MVAAPAALIWSVPRGLDIGRWVVAVLYALAALFAIVLVVRGAGRERIRVTRRELLVERFDVVMWSNEVLGIKGGAKVVVNDRWYEQLSRVVTVATEARGIRLGRWLSVGDARHIADLIRRHAGASADGWGAADGVVRRVAWHIDRSTIPGAEGIVPLADRPWRVVSGTLLAARSSRAWVPLAVLYSVMVTPPISPAPRSAVWIVWPLAALTLGVSFLLEFVAVLRARRRRARCPREPWRAVAVWRSSVVARPAWRRSVRPAVSAVSFAAVAAVVLWSGGAPFSALRASVAAVVGLVAVAFFHAAQNAHFAGLTEVRLREVPLRTPGEIAIDFAVARGGADFETITFALLRVVEVPHRRGRRSFAGYSHCGLSVLPEDQPPPGPGEQVTARFTLPDGVGGTVLSRPRPVFWTLLVEGRTSCGWYAETFPIPIYDASHAARPSPGRGTAAATA